MHSVIPLRRSMDEWSANSGSVFMTWHVFNPNGPTVNCIGWRETGDGEEREVFWRWMHFTGGEDYCLGYVDAGKEHWGRELLEVLTHAFSLEMGGPLKRFPLVTCVPYAVTCLLDEAWQANFRRLIGRSAVVQAADWGRERYYLDKYGANLFDRAGEEYREAYERFSQDPEFANSEYLELMRLRYQHQPTFANWVAGAYASRAMQPGDLEAWWDTVTADEYLVPALGLMAKAWVGASVQSPATQGLSRTRFEEVRDFLAYYEHPLWPESWTTEGIAQSMGLAVPVNGGVDP